MRLHRTPNQSSPTQDDCHDQIEKNRSDPHQSHRPRALGGAWHSFDTGRIRASPRPWRNQTPMEQNHIVAASCSELAWVTVSAVRVRRVSTLTQIDVVLAQRIAAGLAMMAPAAPASAWDVSGTDQPEPDDALGTADARKDSIVGRQVAVLVATGVDTSAIDALRLEAEAGGAALKLLAPHLGAIRTNTGHLIYVDHSLPTMGSVLFDAVFIPGGQRSAAALCANANAVLFVKEAYKHGKAIAACGVGATLIASAAHAASAPHDTFQGPGVFTTPGKTVSKAFIRSFIAAIASHRFTERPDLNTVVA